MTLSITGFIHCNVNCSELDRSRAFYEGLLGLHPTTHTNPDPQDGSGFGMGEGIQWDAWILRAATDDSPGPAVDLLEWKSPKPSGSPQPDANYLGMVRLSFIAPDIEGLHRKLVEAGARVLGPPAGDVGLRVFYAQDPDGTTLEFAEAETEAVQPVAVNVNCSNMERSTEWYCDLLGLANVGSGNATGVPGAAFGLDQDCAWKANFLFFPDEERAGFGIDLVEWVDPRPAGAPYAEANHLGIYRMALGTTDIQGDYEQLMDRGVQCFSPPAWLDLGPEVPSGGCTALFFPDPDGTCVELIQVAPLP